PVRPLPPPPVTLPGPETDTVSWTGAVPPVKVAETLTDAVIVMVHVGAVPEPEQAPPHPANVAPLVGVAARVMDVPPGRPELEHVVAPFPQLMPLPVTVPLPITLTLSVNPVGVV